jgi:hypothetical protein
MLITESGKTGEPNHHHRVGGVGNNNNMRNGSSNNAPSNASVIHKMAPALPAKKTNGKMNGHDSGPRMAENRVRKVIRERKKVPHARTICRLRRLLCLLLQLEMASEDDSILSSEKKREGVRT